MAQRGDQPGLLQGELAAQLRAVPQRGEPGEDLDPCGNWLTGKKVPAKRNSGVITKRMSTEKSESFSRVIENAISGAAWASPVSTATGTARINQAEEKAPAKVPITANATAPRSSRMATKSRCR